ncbi:pyridoxal phosphate-dependent aminotransferase [Breoghania sp.]|uniref:pyridoxal phosphate-dependent aminotransferase n=1 Tax=Breoghania sp. TaxID=2065378 RepID=UPI002AA81AB8|nr:pyridoxal phosphate-dependent aminotransferase [Breoghania sp.]
MSSITEKFDTLKTDNAPGQEGRLRQSNLEDLMRGDKLPGRRVDFSHGDVDAFLPTPGSFEVFSEGVTEGGAQAYTEYRGRQSLREMLAERLAAFTGAPLDAESEVILTPGTQGALFLAVAATVAAGDKVAIVQPDYFANRKLVQFFDGEVCPVQLDYLGGNDKAGLDLDELEDAFKAGAKTFLFSNPSNPTGAVYSPDEIRTIAELAAKYGATVIADQLYSRLKYSDCGPYTHLRAIAGAENVITIMGPSKTESLSGYRLGVAFGSAAIIERMERLQAIVSLRAAGYNQAVFKTWFAEPEGWMEERIRLHQAIRDDLLSRFRAAEGMAVRTPQAGSYLFARMPELAISPIDFVRLLNRQADVIVTPGSEFSPHTLESIRLNYSQDHTAACAAVDRIVELANRYRA